MFTSILSEGTNLTIWEGGLCTGCSLPALQNLLSFIDALSQHGPGRPEGLAGHLLQYVLYLLGGVFFL